MMKVLYGTSNKAKVEHMNELLADTHLEIISLEDVDKSIAPHIEENGNSPLENACIKARAYFDTYKIPVFSCDSGLYIEGLEEERQPGVYIRRVDNKTLSDDEMIDYYSGLVKEQGGQVVAKYKNAICLIMDEDHTYTYDGIDIASAPFILTSKPHHKRKQGFPLDSLSKDIISGEYYFDKPPESGYYISHMDHGFQDFFINAMMDYEVKHFD